MRVLTGSFKCNGFIIFFLLLYSIIKVLDGGISMSSLFVKERDNHNIDLYVAIDPFNMTSLRKLG